MNIKLRCLFGHDWQHWVKVTVESTIPTVESSKQQSGFVCSRCKKERFEDAK